MHTFTALLLLGLGAGALAQPLSTPSLERRLGNTGWMASYSPDDYKCKHAYLLNDQIDDNIHRPELAWVHYNGNPMPTRFTKIGDTDNIGIYFGSGTNKFNTVTMYTGEWDGGKDITGLKAVNSTSHKGGYPGACISAKASGYPWTAIAVTDWNSNN